MRKLLVMFALTSCGHSPAYVANPNPMPVFDPTTVTVSVARISDIDGHFAPCTYYPAFTDTRAVTTTLAAAFERAGFRVIDYPNAGWYVVPMLRLDACSATGFRATLTADATHVDDYAKQAVAHIKAPNADYRTPADLADALVRQLAASPLVAAHPERRLEPAPSPPEDKALAAATDILVMPFCAGGKAPPGSLTRALAGVKTLRSVDSARIVERVQSSLNGDHKTTLKALYTGDALGVIETAIEDKDSDATKRQVDNFVAKVRQELDAR